MKIEFGELRIGDIASQHLVDVMDSNHATAGPKVALFEKKWGELFGYKYNKAVSSGTDACLNMCLSLYDFGAGKGDEIIVPALSFIATSNAVWAANFTPVWVDIRRGTLNIDPALIEQAITHRTRAIMVVHTMGKPCDMYSIMSIAKKYKLKVLEDCCEAHGAKYDSKFVGTFGHAAAFSCFVAHLLTTGEGGMVSTMHANVADVINSTRSHGRLNGSLYFDHVRHGLNSKMNDLEASLGLEAIDQFWSTFNTRRKTVDRIRQALQHTEKWAWYSEEDDGCINCPHGFSITIGPDLSAKLKELLTKKSIHWKRNFGCIPTQHRAFDGEHNHKLGDFPEAEFVGDNGVHIGVHQYLSDDDVEYVCETLAEFFGEQE